MQGACWAADPEPLAQETQEEIAVSPLCPPAGGETQADLQLCMWSCGQSQLARPERVAMALGRRWPLIAGAETQNDN